jgi:hypothetical protein
VLHDKLYWSEVSPFAPDGNTMNQVVSVYVAPLAGGTASTLGEFGYSGLHDLTYPSASIAVTTSSVFLELLVPSSFPITAGGYFPKDAGSAGSTGEPGTLTLFPTGVPQGVRVADVCQVMLSDTDAVYCNTGSLLARVANDGSSTYLGEVVSGPGGTFALDDTYVYWTNAAAAGTVMRAPKTGGTAASVVAHDTDPLAIAVDAKAIYWSDAAGNIMRLIK